MHGERFEVLKLRSMVIGAEKRVDEVVELARMPEVPTVDAPAFKSPEDPRVTRVGRILRRTGIDELPQLINVLAGEMSLVGPRPLVPVEAEALSDVTLEHRHSVPPGLTGLWQVLRTESMPFEERMLLDLLYANRLSLRLDLVLLLATPRSLFRGEGAF